MRACERARERVSVGLSVGVQVRRNCNYLRFHVVPDPFMLPWMQVDKGAIRFILSGANIMCPGLTSPGAKMSKVDKSCVVAVMAEGKQHALCVGVTAMSSEDIAKTNKGIAIENCHYLNDGLWYMKPVK